MRILKLRLKNINSLAGENEIDFTQTIFTNDGLFAITGKTGAGKSSILDAISLALYGKTPRVEVTGSENAVMTRGEKDCYAEVEFEAGGKIWKASWKQELTKTGTLKQVNRQIADGDGKIVADQVRTCDAEITNILGLSFLQFTKVIMLAQGSFAAFLQANKNEKGELLEQITGTEIYGKISKIVFERSVEEKKKLDRILYDLENINMLSDEDITTLNEEVESSTQEKDKRNQELGKLDKAKNWIEELKQLAKAIEEAKIQIPTLEESKKGLAADADKQKKLVEQARNTLKQQQPIFKKVNTLDTQINEKNKSFAPVLNRICELEKDQKNIGQQIAEQKETLEKWIKEVKAKEIWAKEHQKYEELVSKFSAIEHENITLTHAKEEVQKLKSELQTIEIDHLTKKEAFEKSIEQFNSKSEHYTTIAKDLAVKKAELSTILEGKKSDEIQAEKERKTIVKNHIVRLIEIEKSIISTQKEIQKHHQVSENAKKESTKLSTSIEKDKKDAEELQSKLDLLTENIQLVRKVESLEEHRASLKDAEPCPLCGAEEHPYAMGNMPKLDDKEVQLKDEKDKHKSLTAKIQENANMLIELNTNYKYSLLNKEKEQKLLTETTSEKLAITEKIKKLDGNLIISENQDVINTLTEQFEKNENELSQINTFIQKAQNYRKDIETLTDTVIPNLVKEKELAQHKKNEAETNFKIAEQQLKDKTTALQQKQQVSEKDNTKFLAKLKFYGVAQIEDLKNCLDNWEINLVSIKSLKEQIDGVNNKVKLLEKEIESITKSLSEKENEKINFTKELYQLNKERKELFGEKSVEEIEKHLEEAFQSAEKAFETSKKKRDEITVELEKITAVLKEKETSVQKKSAEKLTTKTREEIQEIYEALKTEADEFVEKIGKNRERLRVNNENIKSNEQKLKEKEKQSSIYNKWKNLDNLIGSSDGKKYRNFAQALTFEHLIGLANNQLQKMSDRYILKRIGDNNNPFDLAVIDKFQNNDERTAQNLSGGEKFIVSLSLALGLSSMASKNMRIDTMFIDEGFGTLDSDYLDVALNALSNLQNDGKIIGVISHIAELKERIATHIEIVPNGNGRSRVLVS
jgi:DNA repair protein SbcC/Rad50